MLAPESVVSETNALITNDGVVIGLLLTILGFVFYTNSSEHPFSRSSIALFRLYCFAISYRLY